MFMSMWTCPDSCCLTPEDFVYILHFLKAGQTVTFFALYFSKNISGPLEDFGFVAKYETKGGPCASEDLSKSGLL